MKKKGEKMLKVIISVAVLTVAAVADGQVYRTGQTQSYDGAGNVVTDGSIKDDGYYRAGWEGTYSRANQIVSYSAGLQWQDNASPDKAWVTTDNYDNGHYFTINGDTAINYCNKLGLGNYYDWRLPTIQELQTIVDYGSRKKY